MTKNKPATWTVGNKVDAYTVVRVRSFFAVLKNESTKPAEWAVQTLDGKIRKAKTSAEAGQIGRDYRDAQTAKGVKVERAPRTAKAPAAKTAKAPAKTAKAPAKTAAKRTSAKDKVNGRGTSKPAAKKSVPAAPARTRKPRATR